MQITDHYQRHGCCERFTLSSFNCKWNVDRCARTIPTMSDMQTQQREWLAAIVKATGRSLTAIARKAGVHDSTLTRFMNNPDVNYTLSERTIRLISESEHVQFGQAPIKVGDRVELPDTAFSKRSAWDWEGVSPLDPEETQDPQISKVIEALVKDDQELWKLQDSSLELAAFTAGDILVVDRTVAPNSGDVVIVEISSRWREKVWFHPRVYVPPFVMSACLPLDRPLLVDNNAVRIVATVVLTIRSRKNLGY